MKIFTSILFCLLVISLQAQHSISGNFVPAKDFKWLIAYELTPGSQRYIADTAVNEGVLKLDLPANAVKGIYRLVYALPQNEFYFDVLYNGNEDIEFNFSLEEGISYINSEENKIFNSYFTEITSVENKLINFYQTGQTSKKDFAKVTEELASIQQLFEIRSKGLMAQTFIKANKPYIPMTYETISSYLEHKKEFYFKNLHVEDRVLQASGFVKDKLVNYVFSAIPLIPTTETEMEEVIKKNVKTVALILEDTSSNFQVDTFHELWKKAVENNLTGVADLIYTAHLKEVAIANGQQHLTEEIEAQTRLRIGAPSPEITWKKNDITNSLSSLGEAEYFVLIFWSSTCSHCLKEVPILHQELEVYKNVKVVAIGLENEKENWKIETEKLPHFNHAIALGKWESELAHLFAIHQTPTYFILDKDKRFISKPEDDKEVIEFLKTNKL